VVKSYTYGNGLVELNTFNLDGELDTLTVKNGTANVINRTHQRTDGQNITGIVDNMAAGNSATFAAENAGKLQNADGPWGSRTFYYDGVGNRVTELASWRSRDPYGIRHMFREATSSAWGHVQASTVHVDAGCLPQLAAERETVRSRACL
jgi:hypothetical protein